MNELSIPRSQVRYNKHLATTQANTECFNYFRVVKLLTSSDNSLRYIPDIDECASGPCQNNGTCTDLVLDYNCSCTPGFTGKNCSQGMMLSSGHKFDLFAVIG